MLSPEEKKELIEDARNRKRGESFSKMQSAVFNSVSRSLDAYLGYLAAIQQVLRFPSASRQWTETRFNKL